MQGEAIAIFDNCLAFVSPYDYICSHCALHNLRGLIAQSVEQKTLNLLVASSNLAQPKKTFRGTTEGFCIF